MHVDITLFRIFKKSIWTKFFSDDAAIRVIDDTVCTEGSGRRGGG
jgi:hypothetical protein